MILLRRRIGAQFSDSGDGGGGGGTPEPPAPTGIPTPPATDLTYYAAASGSSGNAGTSAGLPKSIPAALDALAGWTNGGSDTVTLIIDSSESFTFTSSSEVQFAPPVVALDQPCVVRNTVGSSTKARLVRGNVDKSPLSFNGARGFWLYGIEVDGGVSASSKEIPQNDLSPGITFSDGQQVRLVWCDSHHHSNNGISWNHNSGTGCDYVLVEYCRAWSNAYWGRNGNSGISFSTMDSSGVATPADWNVAGLGECGVIIRNSQVWDNVQKVGSTLLGKGNEITDGNGIIPDRIGQNSRYTKLIAVYNNIAVLNGNRGIMMLRVPNSYVGWNTTVHNGQSHKLHERNANEVVNDSGGLAFAGQWSEPQNTTDLRNFSQINSSDPSQQNGPGTPQVVCNHVEEDPTIDDVQQNGQTFTGHQTYYVYNEASEDGSGDNAGLIDARLNATRERGLSGSTPTSGARDITLTTNAPAIDLAASDLGLTPSTSWGGHGVDLDVTDTDLFIPADDALGRARPAGRTGHTLGALVPA